MRYLDYRSCSADVNCCGLLQIGSFLWKIKNGPESPVQFVRQKVVNDLLESACTKAVCTIVGPEKIKFMQEVGFEVVYSFKSLSTGNTIHVMYSEGIDITDDYYDLYPEDSENYD